MVFVDSNIFILDRFFPRDALSPQNKVFVEQLGSFEAGVSVFTLLEVCGAASFRLSIAELESWLLRFTTCYPVRVLDAFGLGGKDAEAWWQTFIAEVSGNVLKKMTFGDAVLLREAESYGVEAIVTWNTRDFSRRTRLSVLTPIAFLRQRLKQEGQGVADT
jgi:predicted nucleic acid-binding protein